MKSAPSLQTIRRTNRKTSFPIGVNLTEDADIEEVRMRVNSVLQTINYPTGYGFTPPFDMDQLEDQNDMSLALLMSVVFVFLIMGSLFESFLPSRYHYHKFQWQHWVLLGIVYDRHKNG